MVITDLKRTCPRCKGRGHQPGFVSMGISQINYDGRCPACAGRGFQLTELGQDLVNLLRPFVEEMIRGDGPGAAKRPEPKGEGAGGQEAVKDAAKDAEPKGSRGAGGKERPA